MNDRVKLVNHPGFIETGDYIQLKMDESPSFIVGKLVKETPDTLTIQHPLTVACMASGEENSLSAMGTVSGTPNSDEDDLMDEEPPEASGMFHPRTVGFVARKFCPFSKQGMVTFEKNKLLSVSEPTEDIIRFWSEFNRKFGNVMEDSMSVMLDKMDPVRSKRLMAPKEARENMFLPKEPSEEVFILDEGHSKRLH